MGQQTAVPKGKSREAQYSVIQTLHEAVSGLAVPLGGNEKALPKKVFGSQSGQGWVFSTTSSVSPVAADAVVKTNLI